MKPLSNPIQFASLLLVALAMSCSSAKRLEHPTLRVRLESETTRIACVGDSITYGSGIEGRETNSYPAVLGRLLGAPFETRNFGVSGATLLRKGDKPYWAEPAFLAVKAYAPHVIIIKLGTNDSKPQNWQYRDDFAGDLREMIDTFRALPSHPQLWICLPVPVYETRWGISEATVAGEIIPLIEKVADEKRVPVIDLYAALSGHPELFPDKIHPNAAGAALMAEAVAGALLGQ